MTPRRLARILRHATAGLGLAIAAGLVALPAAAQDYPSRPIRMVCGVPPGGTTDVMARLVGARLGERFGRQVVVDNRPGASGIIAIQLVAGSQPDGYTLLMSGSSITAVGSLYSKVPFDVARDLVPVAFVATTPFVLVVHPSLPAGSLRDFIAHVKAQAAGVHYAGSTPGTVQHLSGELLKRMTGINLSYVPYKGTGAVLPDLLAGRIQVGIENVVTMRPHVSSGALRGLGVTSATRSAVLPDLPTIAEAGVPGFQSVGRFALFAPAKTPRAIVGTLNKEIAGFMKEPEFRNRLTAQGAEPGAGAPEEIRKQFEDEIAKWAKVIREAGIKLQ
ncbi:MAG: tripartite tricarboxylate transporter substrate binding protein [Burkholderiales bacterium]|nr:tripartite tricarboxylate transporter substrate binding protein [Burkholderiales bacterium]